MSIEVELTGGLGNQLFGFAIGIAASERVQTNLVLNTSQLSHRGYQLPELGVSIATNSSSPIPHSNLIERITRNLRLGNLSGSIKRINEQYLFTEIERIVDKRFFSIQDNTYIRGYFQSAQYFENYRDKITQHLNLEIQSGTHPAMIISDNGEKPWTAVHVRRGDYLNHLEVFQLTSEKYYRKACEMVNSQNKNMRYVVFSDDVDLARDVFPNGNRYIGPEELSNPKQILSLMSNANNLIGSNSSLSWWSAYLSKAGSGLRIFPRPWFLSNLKKDSDILLDDWVSLGN